MRAVTVPSRHRSKSVEVGRSAVALSGGPNTNMIYLARTADGLLAIDLGWWGQSRGLSNALKQLDAMPSDIHWRLAA